MPGRGSSGPMSSAVPSTAAHSHPARTTTVARGRALRLASFRAPPRATRPTTSAFEDGCSSTPAFTTLDWIVPSPRSVETTHNPLSKGTRRVNCERSAMSASYHSDLHVHTARGKRSARAELFSVRRRAAAVLVGVLAAGPLLALAPSPPAYAQAGVGYVDVVRSSAYFADGSVRDGFDEFLS